jgi:tRNA(Leu) C34 or U34 (ribose-2'-O)-methylase TrmL
MSKRGFAGVGLYNPKTDSNVGGALRAASCYSASFVMLYGHRYRKFPADTPRTPRHIPCFTTTDLLDSVPHDCIPVAIEIVKGARPLERYTHPERAFYIFGPEDGSLPKEVLSKCRDIVYIDTSTCMNLAATVNVVLYDRHMKEVK